MDAIRNRLTTGLWMRAALTLGALAGAVAPVAWYCLGRQGTVPEIGAGAGAAVIMGLYAFFRWVRPDVRMLALTLVTACVAIECLAFRVLDFRDMGKTGTLWLLGGLVVVLCASSTLWLRTLSHHLKISPWLNL